MDVTEEYVFMILIFRDTGEKIRLNRYSWGVVMMCTGGGMIQKWSNLYRSESLDHLLLYLNMNVGSYFVHFIPQDHRK